MERLVTVSVDATLSIQKLVELQCVHMSYIGSLVRHNGRVMVWVVAHKPCINLFVYWSFKAKKKFAVELSTDAQYGILTPSPP